MIECIWIACVSGSQALSIQWAKPNTEFSRIPANLGMLSSVLVGISPLWEENTMSPSEWVHSDFAIRKSKRSYAHFDFRTDLSKCSDYITSPEKVATHAFYPFIHYTIEFEKYSKDKGKKIKKREICYASHIDRCIYQYYNHLLDEMYICQKLNNVQVHLVWVSMV